MKNKINFLEKSIGFYALSSLLTKSLGDDVETLVFHLYKLRLQLYPYRLMKHPLHDSYLDLGYTLRFNSRFNCCLFQKLSLTFCIILIEIGKMSFLMNEDSFFSHV